MQASLRLFKLFMLEWAEPAGEGGGWGGRGVGVDVRLVACVED